MSIDHEKRYARLLHASSRKAVHYKIMRKNYEDIKDGQNYKKLVIYED